MTGDAAKDERLYNAIVIMLVVGFFCPLIADRSAELVFPNLHAWGERAPALLTFQFLYPLVAAIGVIVAQRLTGGTLRSSIMLLLGALPFVLLAANTEMAQIMRRLVDDAGAQIVHSFLPTSLVGIATYCGLFIGNRARSLQPGSGGALAIAAMSAGIYLLWLFMPVQSNPPMFRFMWTLTLLFEGLPNVAPSDDSYAVMRVVGGVATAEMALLTAASVLSLVNAFRRPRTDTLARWAVRCWTAALIVSVLGAVIVQRWANSQNDLLPDLLAMFKAVAWMGGLFLLVLAGGTGLFVSPAPAHAPAPDIGISRRPTAARLEDLEKIFRDGLITVEEYERKRAEIVSEL